MLDYLKKKDEGFCCGCRACEQICPKNAIRLTPNDEGFLYPEIDNTLCIHCGMCEKVCPMMNDSMNNEVKSIYSVQSNNQEILMNSSSGGVFRLLADSIVESGGYVVGCVFGEKNRPVLAIVNKKDELLLMQGSKYLFSDTKDVYSRVKILLGKGEIVLFTGTPCQCAGLKNYLQQDYDNLYLADFLCHGVPSQKAFDAYIEQVRRKNKVKTQELEHEEYKFRDKSKMGWGIVSSYSWKSKGKFHKKYYVGLIDSYDYAFTQGYLNRYSCYVCPFKGRKRSTDFTFCDFWGYDRFYDEIDINKGVSALTANTDKAEKIIVTLRNRAKIEKTMLEHVAVENPAILACDDDAIPQVRCRVYSEIEAKGWNYVAKKYFRCKNWYLRRIWYMLPVSIMRFLRRIMRK